MDSKFFQQKKQLPKLGVGLGLRQELSDDIFDHANHIDWLEFVPENYMGLGGSARELLQEAKARFPLISHGVNLSIGSSDDLNRDYLKELKRVLDIADCAWFSDHLCFTSVDGIYIHDLLPLPYSWEAVKHIASRIQQVQDYIERPFLVENISYYMNVPGSEMTDAQFLTEVLQAADCGLLLDVNNVYVSSRNHDLDPMEYLKQVPYDRVVQIHLAGHTEKGTHCIDTHDGPVIDPVWKLYAEVMRRAGGRATLLEWDDKIPAFPEVHAEALRARRFRVETAVHA